jgi:uncharacterized protein YhbP (UPF0306 family)
LVIGCVFKTKRFLRQQKIVVVETETSLISLYENSPATANYFEKNPFARFKKKAIKYFFSLNRYL